MSDSPIHICHIVFRLDVGGLENGLVNLVNRLPDTFRHTIVCLKYATDFRHRIKREDVEIYELGKREGKDLGAYFRAWRLLRRLRPDVVHARNIPTIDMLAIARFAGVRRLVYSEHGLDSMEIHGDHSKYNWMRSFSRFITQRYIAVSDDLANWLNTTIGIPVSRISTIRNGVDTDRFQPGARAAGLLPAAFAQESSVIIGTVGRMDPIKDQMLLAAAFVRLVAEDGEAETSLRLMIVGDGVEREAVQAYLQEHGVEHLAWVPGNRDDTDLIYRSMDVFVLPSKREGISNTLLEAMATGLPVVATDIGGTPEIVENGKTGVLTPVGDGEALVSAIRSYVENSALRRDHGGQSRSKVLRDFSIQSMVAAYAAVYQGL